MIKLLPYLLLVSACGTGFATISKADSAMPVQIVSDHVSFDHTKGIATYFGNVIVDQGTRHLEADKLTIMRDTNNQIKVMIASGKPATFKSQPNPEQTAGSGSANTIKYYPQQDKVDLLQNASLTQNGDTVSGPKLTYNFSTAELQGKGSTKERTTIILQSKRVP